MALSLGKIAILAGAGILGSVLIKEGRIGGVSDVVSGAFKIFKQLGDGSRPSSGKSKNDILKEQIDKLRDQLQRSMPDQPNNIYIYSRSSGARNYGICVIIVVVGGYGYIWWKGWKISDFMFATRRGLSDACTSVAKQLDQVSSSVSSAKRHLSSRIDRVDCNIDECTELTIATKDEVSELRGDLRLFSSNMKDVQVAVRDLETKIGRIDGKQTKTTNGVRLLCEFVQQLETTRTATSIQVLPSRPALELPYITHTSRTVSLPPLPGSEEPPSASSSKSPKVVQPLHATMSTSGLEAIEGILDTMTAVTGSNVPNSPAENPKDFANSSSGRFGWFRRTNPSNILSRTTSGSISFNI